MCVMTRPGSLHIRNSEYTLPMDREAACATSRAGVGLQQRVGAMPAVPEQSPNVALNKLHAWLRKSV